LLPHLSIPFSLQYCCRSRRKFSDMTISASSDFSCVRHVHVGVRKCQYSNSAAGLPSRQYSGGASESVVTFATCLMLASAVLALIIAVAWQPLTPGIALDHFVPELGLVFACVGVPFGTFSVVSTTASSCSVDRVQVPMPCLLRRELDSLSLWFRCLF
jgi:hypothetical protein